MTEPIRSDSKHNRLPENQPLKPGLGEVIGVAGGLPPLPKPPVVVASSPPPPAEPSAYPDLEKRLRSPRTLFSAILSVVTATRTWGSPAGRGHRQSPL